MTTLECHLTIPYLKDLARLYTVVSSHINYQASAFFLGFLMWIVKLASIRSFAKKHVYG